MSLDSLYIWLSKVCCFRTPVTFRARVTLRKGFLQKIIGALRQKTFENQTFKLSSDLKFNWMSTRWCEKLWRCVHIKSSKMGGLGPSWKQTSLTDRINYSDGYCPRSSEFLGTVGLCSHSRLHVVHSLPTDFAAIMKAASKDSYTKLVYRQSLANGLSWARRVTKVHNKAQDDHASLSEGR